MASSLLLLGPRLCGQPPGTPTCASSSSPCCIGVGLLAELSCLLLLLQRSLCRSQGSLVRAHTTGLEGTWRERQLLRPC